MEDKLWLFYSVLAGLCWGTYVPLVQQGIGGLRNAYASFLCVGIAYFLIAVIVPIGVLATSVRSPTWTVYGISFATMAGVAGALGALCVIFANGASRSPADRLYIAPIIFGLAPILNTVISLAWNPSPDRGAFQFGVEHLPGWKLYVGILFTGIGAALVLYSKGEAESAKTAQARPAQVTQSVQSE